ncbi:MAG: hydantoinase B/oxoprolinase family protein [Actinobacteria bacterium]|nr:hydantoinase B/oxoprolinase family protein [Actinomycetota bacterium]
MSREVNGDDREHFVLGPSQSDEERLGAPLKVDPVTFEIVRHKLEAINHEQAIALKDVSVSPIVTAASDFNNALYTADGRIACMGPQVVFHSGAMPVVLRHLMEQFSPEEINEGDMFVVNDPYFGAVHHPDVSLVAPLFHAGAIVAWSGVAAHQVDMGGMSVGSVSGQAREKYQEGLMMPPMKLIEGGVMRKDVWRLILNMTRQPEMVGLDLRGFIASNIVARDRLAEIIDRYGADVVTDVMDELIRYSERRMRERLRQLPDGEFRSRSFIDHDGLENRIYRTDVRLIKSGDVLRFDLSDSSPQAPTYINCTEGCLVGAVFGGTAPLLGAGVPWNHGILNALEVVAPPGVIVNAVRPAPTGAATIGQGWTIMSATAHAVSKLLALSDELRRHSAAITHGTFAALFTGDRNQHGEPYTTQLIDAQIGGGGASSIADGIDQSGCFVAPRPHIANVESNELHGPMLFLYRSFFPDSGGDGARRGGRAAGTAWTPHGVERLRNTVSAHGIEVPVSYGQFGGWPGVCNRQMVIRGTAVRELLGSGELAMPLATLAEPLELASLGGELELLAAKQDEFELAPGDVVQYTWQGGGGYGDPLDRDPAAVAADVEAGLISATRASEVYGVVVGEAAAQIDERRAHLRASRLAPGGVAPAANAELEPVARYGPALVIVRDGAGLAVACGCGHRLGSAAENWKDRALRQPLPAADLPAGILVHAELELARYLCPSCGRLHAVEVEERGEPPLHDLKLISLP